MNKLYFFFDPEHITSVQDPITQAPNDIMHLFFEGITRHELAWLVFLLNKHKWASVDDINTAICRYRKFPKDLRVPTLSTKLHEGAEGGVPKNDAKISMTAYEIMHLALHRYTAYTPGPSKLTPPPPPSISCILTHCLCILDV